MIFDIFLLAFVLNIIYGVLGYFIASKVERFKGFYELRRSTSLSDSWRMRWSYFRFVWSREATERSSNVRALVIAARVAALGSWAALLGIGLWIATFLLLGR
jgi:hypothetical protein